MKSKKIKEYVTAIGALLVAGANAIITLQLMLIGGMIGVPMWFTAVMFTNTCFMGHYGLMKLVNEYKGGPSDCA